MTCKHIFHGQDNCFTILTGEAGYFRIFGEIVNYKQVVSPFILENVCCNCRPGSLRDLLRNQRLSLVASLMLLTGTTPGYQLVDRTIDTWPKHCTSGSRSAPLYPQVSSVYALKYFGSQAMGNNYAITLER